MGTVIDNEKTKEKCQIFTPDNIVNSMLDYLEYTNDLYGKKVLENSCGDGQFLKEIVRRYISDCRSRNIPEDKIAEGLSADIYGIELDANHCAACIENLNEIARNFEIFDVAWKIFNRDALREPVEEKFDFIVGNPPYVSYWDMDKSERDFIKANYSACKFGVCDYSYAFIQDGLSRLTNLGKMVYIVPNSIFKTKSGQKLRVLLKENLVEIYDYAATKVFENVLTSPAIIVINCERSNEMLRYCNMSNGVKVEISKASLGELWVFAKKTKKSDSSETKKLRRFGDYFSVSTSVATQYNKAFVLSGWSDDGQCVSNGTEEIERLAVRKAASPKGMKRRKCEYIIFPYRYHSSGGNVIITHYIPKEYMRIFPKAYSYLYSHKGDLEKRDADKNSEWFEYGRSQALTHLNVKKLLLSTIVTGKTLVYELDEDTVPYSGLFITEKEHKKPLSLSVAKEVLESKAFYEYIQVIGVNASGQSVRITSKNICDYCW
jgi:Type I restriction-modification system methyltransferase subunit